MTSEQDGPRPRRNLVGQIATALALVALAASAAYGGDLLGMRTALQGTSVPPERAPAVSRTAAASRPGVQAEATRVRSYPWWQTVDTLAGDGPASAAVTIAPEAVQWRVSWTCHSGRLVVTTSDRDEPLVDATCPGEDRAYATVTGAKDLRVDATGAWELVVAQQVDVPLVEPPTPAMQAPGTRQVAAGSFYDIDQTGRGRVTIYELAEGGHALRLDDFFVTPNFDLEVRLSPLAAPRTTEEYLSADAVMVAMLDATAGSMNFTIPEGVDPAQFRSVVIWCPPIDSAYAAATLRPVDGG